MECERPDSPCAPGAEATETRGGVQEDAPAAAHGIPGLTAQAAHGHTTAARSESAWQAWLSALATDAEAALAAALAYRELDEAGREAWLCTLEQDAQTVPVPKIAVYAPLLSVETNPERRARIRAALEPVSPASSPAYRPRALRGHTPQGHRVSVLVWPLYMEFVQVIACRYRPGGPIEWVQHDPILRGPSAPLPGSRIAGAVLEEQDVAGVVDELALSVLAHNRRGLALPEALRAFAHVFCPPLQP